MINMWVRSLRLYDRSGFSGNIGCSTLEVCHNSLKECIRLPCTRQGQWPSVESQRMFDADQDDFHVLRKSSHHSDFSIQLVLTMTRPWPSDVGSYKRHCPVRDAVLACDSLLLTDDREVLWTLGVELLSSDIRNDKRSFLLRDYFVLWAICFIHLYLLILTVSQMTDKGNKQWNVIFSRRDSKNP